MQRIAKIIPDDYPDLLAAADEGVSERELARRYRCAPSLVHRHLTKARRLRDLSALEEGVSADRTLTQVEGSTREILERRIRDPNTPARDLASLANALARLSKEDENTALRSPFPFRRGTLVLEPQPKSSPGPGQCRFRLLWRLPEGVKQIADQLTAAEAVYLILCALASELGLTPEMLGVTPEDLAAAAAAG